MSEVRSYRDITAGEPAPWFNQRSTSNERFAFETAAGRYIVLGFVAGAAAAPVDAVERRRALFDDRRASFFWVSADPEDESAGRLKAALPGVRVFWDADRRVARLYGVTPWDGAAGPHRPTFFLLDPTLRVIARAEPGDVDALLDRLAGLPPPASFAGFEVQAPVLVLPNVFEPAFCRQLIALYEANGGASSGVMRQIDGKTVYVEDASFKKRKDFNIEDPALIERTRERVRRCVIPEIEKVHFFQATRMERYIVSCYAAEDAAHFRPHRDNTTAGTAHRRFAVSINLNAEFEGGELSFPEYGPRTFKAPPGAAVVFSCSLLHAVSRVTSGKRYAFLPFLYDDAAAKIREANVAQLAGGAYKA